MFIVNGIENFNLNKNLFSKICRHQLDNHVNGIDNNVQSYTTDDSINHNKGRK